MISSAQVLRDCQKHFNPSETFAPWLAAERRKQEQESHNQHRRRRDKRIQIKIGHGGTLDPLATGVLIAGVGKGTKSLQQFLLCTKTYEAVILFGTGTDSYDRVGKVLKKAPYDHITRDMVEKALGQFRGKFMQLPPLFSALKMDGKPLYEYAREGKPIPRKIERRPVEVLSLELVEWLEGDTHPHKAPSETAGHAEINLANQLWKQEGAEPSGRNADEDTKEEFESRKRKMSEDQDELVTDLPRSKHRKSFTVEEPTMSGGLAESDSTPEAAAARESPLPTVKGPPACKIRMTVTSGFYVRSLCHDLGAAVGSAALMAELERTRQGDFEVGGKNCLEYSDLEKGEEVWGPKVEKMLDDWYDKEEAVARANKEQVAAQIKADEENDAAKAEKHKLGEDDAEVEAKKLKVEGTVDKADAVKVDAVDDEVAVKPEKEKTPALDTSSQADTSTSSQTVQA
jgi:tRNA pseudouridine55 synthase